MKGGDDRETVGASYHRAMAEVYPGRIVALRVPFCDQLEERTTLNNNANNTKASADAAAATAKAAEITVAAEAATNTATSTEA